MLVANGVVSLDTAFTDGLYWKLGGNAGTVAGADVIGTTDDQALELHVTGVRALRSILEGILLDSMFELPGYDSVEEVVINKEVVEGRVPPLLIYADRREELGSGAS